MANYKIGSIGDLISGKTNGSVEIQTVVYQELAPKPRQANNLNPSFDDQLSLKKEVSSNGSTVLSHGKKILGKITASLSKKRKVEIGGDAGSKTVGVSYNTHISADPSEVDGVKSQSDSSFYQNAARRVHIKNNTRKHVDDPERNSRTVFVGNIPTDHSKKKKLIKFFSNYGQVESVRIRCAPLKDPRVSKKVSVIKNEFHPERSSISAYVVFKTSDNAKAALEANGTVFHDHHLRVDIAKNAEKQVDPKKSVFLGNVPFAAEEEDLWQMFSECGKIESVRIVRDPITSVSKGIAFVNFQTSDAAELALHLDGNTLKKRNISVKRHRPSAKSTLAKPLTDKAVRHKALDDKTKSKLSANDEIRMAKKAKRKMRRDGEKALGIVKKKKKNDSTLGLEKKTGSKHIKLDAGNTDVKENTINSNENKVINIKNEHVRFQDDSMNPEENKVNKGKNKHLRFQGKTVDESKKKKKKKLNKGAQKKKKIALLLSGEKKKQKV